MSAVSGIGIIDRDKTEAVSTVRQISNEKSTEFSAPSKMKINEQKLSDNLRQYVKQVTLAQEEERLRIARELHDTTVQSLIAVLHQSERFLENNQSFNMPYIRFLLRLSEEIKSIIREVRHLSSNLRPSILDHLGLVPSVHYITGEYEKTYGIEIDLAISGNSYRFLPEVEVSIFRIIQEALQNIIRHAEATKAEVVFRFDKDEVIFTIRDNGKGISDLPQEVDELPCKGKLGLAGMFERVELIDGKISLQTGLGEGTLIMVSFPVSGNLAS